MTKGSTGEPRQLDKESATWDQSASIQGDETRRRTRGSGLTPEIIEALKVKGANQNEIAERFGVSRQYVSQVKHQVTGFSMSVRDRVRQSFPFKVKAEHQGASVNKRLRDHSEYMMTGGKGMSLDKRKRLLTFYRNLTSDNTVVVYDPALPPVPGVATTGGWAFVEREDSDGDLMIRLNEHAHLADKDRPLWRVPRTWPSVE